MSKLKQTHAQLNHVYRIRGANGSRFPETIEEREPVLIHNKVGLLRSHDDVTNVCDIAKKIICEK